jgi:ABC-type thiamine transport system ATPase subunit
VLGDELAFVRQALASVMLRDVHSVAIVDDAFDALAPILRAVERALHAGFSDGDPPSRVQKL